MNDDSSDDHKDIEYPQTDHSHLSIIDNERKVTSTTGFPAIEAPKTDSPFVKCESAVLESPSCNGLTSQTKDELDHFSALLFKEIGAVKSQKLLRNLKMNIMQMVYKAQEEEEALKEID